MYFARKQILRKPLNLWKLTERLKHNVKPVHTDPFLFTMLFKLVASQFFVEKSSRRDSAAIGAYWKPCQ